MCKKKRYIKKKIAKMYAKQVSAKYGVKHRVYKCEECSCYHTTTCSAENRTYFRKKKYYATRKGNTMTA